MIIAGGYDKHVFYGNSIEIHRQDEECTIFMMKDDSGTGVMTSYDVFPGIKLMYNDFQMKSCFSEFRPYAQMLTIDHCREGRIECEVQNGSYMYLDEGDLQISTKNHPDQTFGFPLNEYRGITIGIYLDEAMKASASIFEPFSVDLRLLCAKFCNEDRSFLMRTTEPIRQIFTALYAVPELIRIPYFRIKIIELLLILSAVDVSEDGESRPYFPKKQVETVKVIMDYIRNHLDRHMTLQDLSSRFNISQTAMKLCFKAIYGQSIYAYLRKYRIERAAYLLRHSDDTITIIAGKVGYSNPSKFAAAFKAIKGMTPAMYQKDVVRMEHTQTDWSG